MCRDSLLDWQRAQTGLDSNRRTETPHAGHLCVCRASESFTRPGPLPFRRGAVSGRGGARAGVHLRSVVPGSPSPGNALSRQRPPTIRHRAIHMGPGLPCQGGGLKLADNGDRRPRAGLALRRCRNATTQLRAFADLHDQETGTPRLVNIGDAATQSRSSIFTGGEPSRLLPMPILSPSRPEPSTSPPTRSQSPGPGPKLLFEFLLVPSAAPLALPWYLPGGLSLGGSAAGPPTPPSRSFPDAPPPPESTVQASSLERVRAGGTGGRPTVDPAVGLKYRTKMVVTGACRDS
ncbi:hypothetical protein Purlil1_1077 [Purpureocillium lilacinum]|uniref:Uncharacterized protein n=1 Tax=Purpureocillium lilacinum TaxID=33203 RepID=A0ABR0CE21_PURLI|nr:hypothetical protein Purlil1_1077 [Purpureocillium lilacinum]